MYQFSSNTKVSRSFKMSEIFKLIKADKDLKLKSANVESVEMTNALSKETTNLSPSTEVNEIYVMKIVLSSSQVPYEFLKAFDKAIHFQVLFEMCYNDKVKYITGFKQITDEKISQTRFFETEWKEQNLQEMPLVNSLESLYKQILSNVSRRRFRQEESIKSWLQRIAEIESLEKEAAKIEKQMNAEKQPNIKMQLNDERKKILKEIGSLEE